MAGDGVVRICFQVSFGFHIFHKSGCFRRLVGGRRGRHESPSPLVKRVEGTPISRFSYLGLFPLYATRKAWCAGYVYMYFPCTREFVGLDNFATEVNTPGGNLRF